MKSSFKIIFLATALISFATQSNAMLSRKQIVQWLNQPLVKDNDYRLAYKSMLASWAGVAATVLSKQLFKHLQCPQTGTIITGTLASVTALPVAAFVVLELTNLSVYGEL